MNMTLKIILMTIDNFLINLEISLLLECKEYHKLCAQKMKR